MQVKIAPAPSGVCTQNAMQPGKLPGKKGVAGHRGNAVNLDTHIMLLHITKHNGALMRWAMRRRRIRPRVARYYHTRAIYLNSICHKYPSICANVHRACYLWLSIYLVDMYMLCCVCQNMAGRSKCRYSHFYNPHRINLLHMNKTS